MLGVVGRKSFWIPMMVAMGLQSSCANLLKSQGESYASPPSSLLTPDIVETRLGTLEFFDGLPSTATVEKVYDNLMVGIGSQYAIANVDADGNYLDGSKTYSVTLPPGIPAKDFWSFVLYDQQTRSLLQTPRTVYHSLGSQNGDVRMNADGSCTVWFGPEPPDSQESNWIQTVPGKGWFTILRLYGPLESWFDKTWKPGEIELVSNR